MAASSASSAALTSAGAAKTVELMFEILAAVADKTSPPKPQLWTNTELWTTRETAVRSGTVAIFAVSGRLSTCCRRSGGDRAVAQFGSALDWGSSGRRFKSCQPDHVMSQDIG